MAGLPFTHHAARLTTLIAARGGRARPYVNAIRYLVKVGIQWRAMQDRDGARPLLWNLRKAFPKIKLAWADGGYASKLVTWAKTKLKPKLTLQIVRRPDDLRTFQVLPRRWVVE
jgi:transposase